MSVLGVIFVVLCALGIAGLTIWGVCRVLMTIMGLTDDQE